MTDTNNNRTAKKLTGYIITVVILAVCLCITTVAIVLASVSVKNNLFQTGSIKINLNDGHSIIGDGEFLLEPGMTVKKDFFIKNESTFDVYYKLYFNNVSGGLADVLEITIKDGDKVLFHGTPAELNRADTAAADDILRVNDRRDLIIYFYFPDETGNSAQNKTLIFDFCADAVQTKNNPNKLFDSEEESD